MSVAEKFLTWDELLKQWGMEPSELVFLLCRADYAKFRPSDWDRSLEYPGFRPKKIDFVGWDNAFQDVLFSYSDIAAYEERFPHLRPSARLPSQPKSKKQLKEFPDSQRHYWRCRAVARVLWQENRALSPAQIAASTDVSKFGCEDQIDAYGRDGVEKWISDVCSGSYKDGEPKDFHKNDQPLFDPKPKMRPEQRHRESARAVAALLWSRDRSVTIADMILRDEVNGIACEGSQRNYNETILRRWIKDLRPQDQPAGRPKSKQRCR